MFAHIYIADSKKRLVVDVQKVYEVIGDNRRLPFTPHKIDNDKRYFLEDNDVMRRIFIFQTAGTLLLSSPPIQLTSLTCPTVTTCRDFVSHVWIWESFSHFIVESEDELKNAITKGEGGATRSIRVPKRKSIGPLQIPVASFSSHDAKSDKDAMKQVLIGICFAFCSDCWSSSSVPYAIVFLPDFIQCNNKSQPNCLGQDG